MSCETPVLGRRSCILYPSKWNACNVDIDARDRAVVANDTPVNHLVVLPWASYAKGLLYVGYLGVHQCKCLRTILLRGVGTSN